MIKPAKHTANNTSPQNNNSTQTKVQKRSFLKPTRRVTFGAAHNGAMCFFAAGRNLAKNFASLPLPQWERVGPKPPHTSLSSHKHLLRRCIDGPHIFCVGCWSTGFTWSQPPNHPKRLDVHSCTDAHHRFAEPTPVDAQGGAMVVGAALLRRGFTWVPRN